MERPDVPGNVARAIETFQDAIRKDPKFALAHAGLGEAYWTQYQETKDEAAVTMARSEITEALRLDPDQPLTRFALARLYQGTGRPDEAIEELHRLLTLQPGNDDAHRVLGDILLSKGRNEEALDELSKAVELRPDYWENHRILGRAYYQLGRYRDAVRSLTRVTELQPDNSRGFQMLGAVYDKMGNDDQALVFYRRAIELNPDARAYSNLGTLYYRQGKFAEAAQAYSEAARLEPSPAKHRNLGDLYARLGQAARAREQYQRAVELSQSILSVNPKDAHALGLLAVSEAKLGRHDAAARHAEEAVALAPLDAEVLYRKAVVAALAGRTGPALTALRQALNHGYSAADAARDEDFGSLRDSPAFRQLVGRSPVSADKGGM